MCVPLHVNTALRLSFVHTVVAGHYDKCKSPFSMYTCSHKVALSRVI